MASLMGYLRALRRPRTDNVRMLLGSLWFTRNIFIVCSLITLGCGEWLVFWKCVSISLVCIVAGESIEWLHPSHWRNGKRGAKFVK